MRGHRGRPQLPKSVHLQPRPSSAVRRGWVLWPECSHEELDGRLEVALPGGGGADDAERGEACGHAGDEAEELLGEEVRVVGDDRARRGMAPEEVGDDVATGPRGGVGTSSEAGEP